MQYKFEDQFSFATTQNVFFLGARDAFYSQSLILRFLQPLSMCNEYCCDLDGSLPPDVCDRDDSLLCDVCDLESLHLFDV